MSRSPQRTRAQKRALQQAQDLYAVLKTRRVPQEYRRDDTVPTLVLLLQRARAHPKDIGTTDKRLQNLDLTLCHQAVHRWVRQLRKLTAPERPWNLGTGAIAELLAHLSRWESIDPARAKTTPEEITSLIRIARIKGHVRNMHICEVNILKALKVFNDVKEELTADHQLTVEDLGFDESFIKALETLNNIYTAESETASSTP